MLVSQILKAKGDLVFTVGPAETVGAICALLHSRRVGAMVVLDADRVVGIVSERDLVRAMAKEGAAALTRSVGEVMTSPPIVVERETGVMEALSLMTRRRVRHLPVVEGGRMVGMISIGDLVKIRVEQAESEAEAMREYIQTA